MSFAAASSASAVVTQSLRIAVVIVGQKSHGGKMNDWLLSEELVLAWLLKSHGGKMNDWLLSEELVLAWHGGKMNDRLLSEELVLAWHGGKMNDRLLSEVLMLALFGGTEMVSSKFLFIFDDNE